MSQLVGERMGGSRVMELADGEGVEWYRNRVGGEEQRIRKEERRTEERIEANRRELKTKRD